MINRRTQMAGVGSNNVSKAGDTKSGGRPMGGKEIHKKLMGGKKKKRTSMTSSS